MDVFGATTDSTSSLDRDAIRPALEAKAIMMVRGRRTVLRNVDFAIAPGEMVALLGANGAGKTTLLQCLAGFLRPASGEVFWLGRPATRSPAARRCIGYLAHESGLYLELTAQENLLFAGRMCGLADVSRRAAELLAILGLENKAGQPVQRLSVGMRRRLAIARAVIHRPPIVLLDEPFANLDARYRSWLAEFLAELRNVGAAICFTSHDPDFCRNIADRLIGLHAGAISSVEESASESEAVLPFAARA